MNDKEVTFEYVDENPSFGRKDMLPIRSLMPLWFRGADLKIAQGVLKIARDVHKLISEDLRKKTPGLENKLAYRFESKSDDKASFYNNDIFYSVENATGFALRVRYVGHRDDDLKLTGHVQNPQTSTPIEGLVARLNDEIRLNREFCDSDITDSVKLEKVLKLIIDMVAGFKEGIVLPLAPSFHDKTIMFAVMARNNHGRTMYVTISTENKEF